MGKVNFPFFDVCQTINFTQLTYNALDHTFIG